MVQNPGFNQALRSKMHSVALWNSSKSRKARTSACRRKDNWPYIFYCRWADPKKTRKLQLARKQRLTCLVAWLNHPLIWCCTSRDHHSNCWDGPKNKTVESSGRCDRIEAHFSGLRRPLLERKPLRKGLEHSHGFSSRRVLLKWLRKTSTYFDSS